MSGPALPDFQTSLVPFGKPIYETPTDCFAPIIIAECSTLLELEAGADMSLHSEVRSDISPSLFY